MLRLACAVLLPAFPTLISCAADSGSDAEYVGRDTLPNGVLHVTYSRLPVEGVATATTDLSMGVVDGDPNLTFGDVRGIDADEMGRIYVLDNSASEIRAFDSSGRFLYTVARQGEGPGEIGRANGMILVGDTILWVQDHSKWMMIGLSPKGMELMRVPMHVLSYGYLWSGTVDNHDRIWKTDHLFDGKDSFSPREGLNEPVVTFLQKSLDLVMNARDSVDMGDAPMRIFEQAMGRGSWQIEIPFSPTRLSVVDPDGGFWQVYNAAYRLARLDETGDTTVVVEVKVAPIPVTESERDDLIDRLSSRAPGLRRAAEEVEGYMPDIKPVIQKLVVDDEGRLWVERTVRVGSPPRYDVFDRTGEWLGSVELGFHPDPTGPIRVRHGHIYAVVLDALDVPSIVRAAVPNLIDTRDGEG